ncbi:Neuroligin-4, X-linked [Nymphon striatum]|nr:Neuroligin-4, X-linked [Nymphon striatum]
MFHQSSFSWSVSEFLTRFLGYRSGQGRTKSQSYFTLSGSHLLCSVVQSAGRGRGVGFCTPDVSLTFHWLRTSHVSPGCHVTSRSSEGRTIMVKKLMKKKHFFQSKNYILITSGIILTDPPEKQLEEYEELYGMYDLLLGITKVEEYSFMTPHEAKLGITAARRDSLIRQYVDNMQTDRTRDLAAMIVNEYTDWTQTVPNPLSTLDSVIEAIGDAEVVAPLISAAQLHSELQERTYVYVFGHQTKFGDYSDRLGCIRGEELAYVFGAPLLDTPLSYFTANYTSLERELSEAVITLWTNFAKSGDPNSATGKMDISTEQGSQHQLFLWPNYEPINQRYLYISARPKVRDHYRAHKLSLWLNLVPQILEIPYENPSADYTEPYHFVPWHTQSSTTLTTTTTKISTTQTTWTASQKIKKATITMETSQTQNTQLTITPDMSTLVEKTHNKANERNSNMSDKSVLHQPNEELKYSSALSVTIAVGCSLLVLNALAFAGMYYQQDKSRKNRHKPHRRSSNTSKESFAATFIQPTNTIPCQSTTEPVRFLPSIKSPRPDVREICDNIPRNFSKDDIYVPKTWTTNVPVAMEVDIQRDYQINGTEV